MVLLLAPLVALKLANQITAVLAAVELFINERLSPFVFKPLIVTRSAPFNFINAVPTLPLMLYAPPEGFIVIV